MKNIFTRSLKTTLFGLGSIACMVVPVFLPAATPICAKLATVLGGLGLVAARDHSDGNPPSNSGNKLNSFAVLPLVCLAALALASSSMAFVSQYQPTSYRVFIGTGEPNTNAFATNSGTGSFYVDVTDQALPVLWVKTGTNGFATVTSSGAVSNVFWADNAGNAAGSDYALNATHALSADEAVHAEEANHANTATTAGTSGFADNATSANTATRADSATRLHDPSTENIVEFVNVGAGAWTSSTDIQCVNIRMTGRTNVISIKPSAVAAFLALVPGGLVTNSVPVALPTL